MSSDGITSVSAPQQWSIFTSETLQNIAIYLQAIYIPGYVDISLTINGVTAQYYKSETGGVTFIPTAHQGVEVNPMLIPFIYSPPQTFNNYSEPFESFEEFSQDTSDWNLTGEDPFLPRIMQDPLDLPVPTFSNGSDPVPEVCEVIYLSDDDDDFTYGDQSAMDLSASASVYSFTDGNQDTHYSFGDPSAFNSVYGGQGSLNLFGDESIIGSTYNNQNLLDSFGDGSDSDAAVDAWLFDFVTNGEIVLIDDILPERSVILINDILDAPSNIEGEEDFYNPRTAVEDGLQSDGTSIFLSSDDDDESIIDVCSP